MFWNISDITVINVSCYSLKVKVISLHNTTLAKVCVKLFTTTCNLVLEVLFHFHYNYAKSVHGRKEGRNEVRKERTQLYVIRLYTNRLLCHTFIIARVLSRVLGRACFGSRACFGARASARVLRRAYFGPRASARVLWPSALSRMLRRTCLGA